MIKTLYKFTAKELQKSLARNRFLSKQNTKNTLNRHLKSFCRSRQNDNFTD